MVPFDSQHADEFTALLAVAREGSFVAAARVLQRHATVLSKRIAALERRLGIRLVERNTRQVRLTEAEARLVDRLGSVANLIEEAELEAAASAATLHGKLRVSFPASMGRLWIAPRLPDFMRRFPGLEVEAHYSERYVDIVGEGFDAAVRVGVLRDSRLVIKRLGYLRRVLGASPAYLARAGSPSAPADLASHNCLEFTRLTSFPEWRLSNGETVERVLARGSLRSNDPDALLAAAKADVGILGASEWLMTRDFAAGTLLRVLPAWTFDTDGGVYLVRPSPRFPSARNDAFAKWIVAVFGEGMPWLRVADPP